MNTWFTADFHFYHENIIKYSNRPFKNIKIMHDVLINNYNSLVDPEDEVYIIGDLSLIGPENYYSLERIVKRMNGNKHLILGNHDRLKPSTYLEIGFESVHTSLPLLYIVDNKRYSMILNHDPTVACMFPEKTILCGHVHNLFKTIENVINVGVDVWKFNPVNLMDILTLPKNE